MNNRVYESGALKQKKAKRALAARGKLPKIDAFFAKKKLVPEGGNIEMEQGNLENAQNGNDKTVSNFNEIENVEKDTKNCTEVVDECAMQQDERVAAVDCVLSILSSGNSEISCYELDPELWKIEKNMVNYWIRQGRHKNIEKDFRKSLRVYQEGEKIKNRYLTMSAFKRELPNGELVDREWLMYSPSSGRVYCFSCRLLSDSNSPFAKTGFNDWKHAHEALKEHENSIDHRKSMLTYLERKKAINCIDSQLAKQFANEQLY